MAEHAMHTENCQPKKKWIFCDLHRCLPMENAQMDWADWLTIQRPPYITLRIVRVYSHWSCGCRTTICCVSVTPFGNITHRYVRLRAHVGLTRYVCQTNLIWVDIGTHEPFLVKPWCLSTNLRIVFDVFRLWRQMCPNIYCSDSDNKKKNHTPIWYSCFHLLVRWHDRRYLLLI